MIADLQRAIVFIGPDGRLTADGWMELDKLVRAIRALEQENELLALNVLDHETRISALEP